MVISNSFLSLLVFDVNESLKTINLYIESLGGYLINSSLTSPEEGTSGIIVLRIPVAKIEESLEKFRQLSVKVISETLEGEDVTDQFVDNEAILKILESNKARFEEVMNSAFNIEEILKVQKEIFNLQNQIDNVKGQQNFLEQNTKMAKVTIYLSADEFSLPYVFVNSWRPSLIFKQATRSLIITLQKIGSVVIWLGVFSVILVPWRIDINFSY